MKKDSPIVKRLTLAVSVIFWLAVWQIAAMALDKEILLVSPISVVKRLSELVVTAQFWQAVATSFVRILIGFGAALVVGILLATAASAFSPIKALLAPPMAAIRAVPVASFIILVLIWFSSERLSSVVSFLMVLPVIYSNTLGGISSIDRDIDEMADVFELRGLRRLRCLWLAQIMPSLLTGCEISLGLCWKSGIAAEVIGMPDHTIGEALQQAKVYLDTPDLFAWTVVIVLVSTLFAKLFMVTAKAVTRLLTRT